MSNKISLNQIPADINYEGYLWWSDQENPDVYNNEPLVNQLNKPIWPKPDTNPFIIEGNLWDKTNKISYLIRFIDGEYRIFGFDLKQRISRERITFHNHLANRINGVTKLRFVEVWQPQSDPLCNGFEVLKPAFIAFVGFKKQEEKK